MSPMGPTPIRTHAISPNSSHQDSKNLVNLLNLSRHTLNPAAAAAAAAAMASAAASSSISGQNLTSVGNKEFNAKKPTTIIHEDDEEMTFKQEPASPPPTSGSSPPRTNGKQWFF